MKRILVVSGSRADYGLLEWPIKLLSEAFDVRVMKIWGHSAQQAMLDFSTNRGQCDLVLLLGDRYEIMSVAFACHLLRIPIAHIAGGDVTEGSYDNAMRDCISRMASIHFVTSTSAMARLTHMGCTNIHLVGNPGIDYIRHADWKRERPYAEPYVVVNYQPETIDGEGHFQYAWEHVEGRKAIVIRPNPDKGSDDINASIDVLVPHNCEVIDFLPHAEYLNLLFHCDELIGNSSSMLYEAPELGIKTRMIGRRQRGRTIPYGDGNASKRIVNILKYT